MDSPFCFARDLRFGDSRPILRQGRRAAFQMIPFRRTVNKTFSLFPAGCDRTGHPFSPLGVIVSVTPSRQKEKVLSDLSR